jgi:hypothetical protein
MRLFVFADYPAHAPEGGDRPAPDGRKAATPRAAERQGGIGAMRSRSVGGLVGGGGDTGRTSLGEETQAGAASEGSRPSGPGGSGASRTSGPGRVTGEPWQGDPEGAPAGPPPGDDDFGPPPGDRAFHSGEHLAGENLPSDSAAVGSPRTDNLGPGRDRQAGPHQGPLDPIAGTGPGTARPRRHDERQKRDRS